MNIKEGDMSNKLTSKQFWQEKWVSMDCSKWDDGSFAFLPEWHQVLYDYLVKYRGGNCLEVGCFPGRYLWYFANTFNMKVEGIDFMTPDDSMMLKIHNCDFFEFSLDKKYDVVCSFGFIEHFEMLGDVIQRHMDLVRDGGMVVMTVPNFVHGWRFHLRRRYDRELFTHHNRDAMVVHNIENILEGLALKGYTVKPVKFSDKTFFHTSRLKRKLGKAMASLTKYVPLVDRALATEVLITVEK
jgi:2-polyprenyl-3-methyl-5-hydroxy-6-metoxy-1,4-benzoquinol methylase